MESKNLHVGPMAVIVQVRSKFKRIVTGLKHSQKTDRQLAYIVGTI